MPDAIFLVSLCMCSLQVRCSSMCTPRDLVRGTCFIGTPSIANDGAEIKVDRRCMEPISMNSVLDWFRVSLLGTSHSLTFARS